MNRSRNTVWEEGGVNSPTHGFRPKKDTVVVAIVCCGNVVLLNVDGRWKFPEGGIAQGTTPEQVVIRGIGRSIGLTIRREELRLLSHGTRTSWGVPQTVHFFGAEVQSLEGLNGFDKHGRRIDVFPLKKLGRLSLAYFHFELIRGLAEQKPPDTTG